MVVVEEVKELVVVVVDVLEWVVLIELKDKKKPQLNDEYDEKI